MAYQVFRSKETVPRRKRCRERLCLRPAYSRRMTSGPRAAALLHALLRPLPRMEPQMERPLLRAALATLLLTAALPTLAGSSLRQLEVHEPVTGTTMPAMVFYPTRDVLADTATVIGPYQVKAQPGAAIAGGRFPLVLISHGHAGSALGHHDLATTLADAGFIVASIEHAGDSYRDQSGFGTERVLLGRAWQVSALLDGLLADPQLGPHIDQDRVGVAGFSAGGYTSLLLLGAQPDFSRHATYCQAQPQDVEICQLPAANAEPLAQRPATADARIQAGFVMAPLGVFFDRAALQQVTAPVHLYAAMADRVLLPNYNVLPVRDGLPNLRAFRPIVGADHYVFLAPCGPEMAESVPVLCKDPPGIDRALLHRQINEDAVAFFRQVFFRATPAVAE